MTLLMRSLPGLKHCHTALSLRRGHQQVRYTRVWLTTTICARSSDYLGKCAGGRPGKKTKVTSPLEPQPEAPAFPYVALQRQTLPDHLRPFAQVYIPCTLLACSQRMVSLLLVSCEGNIF